MPLSVLAPLPTPESGPFTRAGSANYLDRATGFIKSAATDVPRFNYDFVTNSVSLLTEAAATNLILNSEVFDSWSKGGCTVGVNAAIAPDGNASADKLIEDTSLGDHYVTQNVTVAAAQPYTYSVFVKPAGRNFLQIGILNNNGTSGLGYVIYDLTLGAVSSSGKTGSGTLGTPTVVKFPNGWFRVSTTMTLASDVTSAGIYLLPQVTAGGGTQYTGDASSGLYLWGAQAEAGVKRTTYIATTSAAVTRAADVFTASMYSSVPEDSVYSPWSAATTYVLGDRCYSATTHRIYECVKAGTPANLNKDPTDPNNRTGATSTWWIDYAPTNRWAMFDDQVNTQTTASTSLTVVVRPGYLNSMYIAAVEADVISICIKDAPNGNVIYSYYGVLEGSAPSDWYEYFFDPFRPLTDFLVSGVDPFFNAEMTLILSKSAGTVKCGIIALGDLKPLGGTQYGAKAKPKTYSFIKVDDYGNNQIVKRKSAKDMSASAFLKLKEANSVLDIITNLLDVPCVWIGTDIPEYQGLRCFGLGSAEISYDHLEDCMLNLSVQGLI